MASYHVEECITNREIVTEPTLIVPISMHSSGDFDYDSINNILSLAVWKDPSSALDEVFSPVHTNIPTTDLCLLSTNLSSHHSSIKCRRCCRGKKHTSMYSLMGVGEPSQD